MADLRPITLITGASVGIGAALARVFAANGHATVLVARREQLLANLAEEIAATGAPRPVVLRADLGSIDAASRIGEQLTALDLEPEFVVNNAGFGLVGPAAELSRAEQLAMIDLNVRALTDLSLAWVDALARHRGGILNVASVAAFLPGPGMAVYYASKAYVLSFSEALHQELAPRGVRVTALCPGPVPTEFQERAGVKDLKYPRALTRSPERVAEEGYRALKEGRRVVVPGFANQLVTQLVGFFPRKLVLNAMAARNRRD
ncbi:MAG TPA: SDR family oxidoreductase [Xanthobacteraceae bacterium]|jgi:short-subunit dehydrogenase|nr:SDR family oxidoreductase [Xanthobacteraceae bacterium]